MTISRLGFFGMCRDIEIAPPLQTMLLKEAQWMSFLRQVRQIHRNTPNTLKYAKYAKYKNSVFKSMFYIAE